MYPRFPWELVTYHLGYAEHTLGKTGTDIKILNIYINIFKTMNVACDMRYLHIILPRDVPKEPKTYFFSKHSFH
jgi:hypothetical protein